MIALIARIRWVVALIALLVRPAAGLVNPRHLSSACIAARFARLRPVTGAATR